MLARTSRLATAASTACASVNQPKSDDLMMDRWPPEYADEDGGSQTPLAQHGTSTPSRALFDTVNVETGLTVPSGLQRSLGESKIATLARCRTRENLTGASLPQIRRGLVRARRLMLASRIDEAFGAIDQIELQLDDMLPAVARRLRRATQLLRASGLALQDDSLAALAIAESYLTESPASQHSQVALTLCRLGFWQLRKFNDFYSLPRHRPRVRWSKSSAVSAMFELSIEAAAALDHLHMSTAKRLASDALDIAETTLKAVKGFAALPACLSAQLLYEEGRLDEAERIFRDRLSAISAEGSIDSALRAYLGLARIARYGMQYDHASLVLREGQDVGERRRWPRLVAACLSERVSLLLDAGQLKEARSVVEYLDRYAEAHQAGSGYARSEIMRYRTLARWRTSWADAPSGEAVIALRQLYHHHLEKGDLYAACRLAVKLAEMLTGIGESGEADALFIETVKACAPAGLYQMFLEGGPGLGMLLRQAYSRADASGSMDRQLLPFVGSLLSRWDARHGDGRSAPSSSRVSDTLTTRERDVLSMISRGSSNKRVAQSLNISPETVKSHVKRIFLKLAVGTRTEAVSRAGSLGLL
jgi:ATP/maltotriose-dependent transcriptional regulator MalT